MKKLIMLFFTGWLMVAATPAGGQVFPWPYARESFTIDQLVGNWIVSGPNTRFCAIIQKRRSSHNGIITTIAEIRFRDRRGVIGIAYASIQDRVLVGQLYEPRGEIQDLALVRMGGKFYMRLSESGIKNARQELLLTRKSNCSL